MDVNLDGLVVVDEDGMRLVPVVAVRQNVYPVTGKGLVVHGGKTSMALRIVPLPEFVVDRLRARRLGDEPPTGRSSPPPAATAGRPTGGPRRCAARVRTCARRSGWTG